MNRNEIVAEEIGEYNLKGISYPVKVYKVPLNKQKLTAVPTKLSQLLQKALESKDASYLEKGAQTIQSFLEDIDYKKSSEKIKIAFDNASEKAKNWIKKRDKEVRERLPEVKETLQKSFNSTVKKSKASLKTIGESGILKDKKTIFVIGLVIFVLLLFFFFSCSGSRKTSKNSVVKTKGNSSFKNNIFKFKDDKGNVIDFSQMSRSQLKRYIKQEGLDIDIDGLSNKEIKKEIINALKRKF
jgi:hypothetical protein